MLFYQSGADFPQQWTQPQRWSLSCCEFTRFLFSFLHFRQFLLCFTLLFARDIPFAFAFLFFFYRPLFGLFSFCTAHCFLRNIIIPYFLYWPRLYTSARRWSIIPYLHYTVHSFFRSGYWQSAPPKLSGLGFHTMYVQRPPCVITIPIALSSSPIPSKSAQRRFE